MPADEMGSRALPEPPRVATRPILIAVFGFLAFVAAVLVGVHFYFRAFVDVSRLQAVTSNFPEPTLQISPHSDLERFEKEQRKPLEGYAWIDRQQDVARIPIEDAMRFVAKRGADAYEPIGMPAVTPSPARTGRGDQR